MLRAASSHEQFKQITAGPEGGVIVNPIITAGGWIYIVKNAGAIGQRINATGGISGGG